MVSFYIFEAVHVQIISHKSLCSIFLGSLILASTNSFGIDTLCPHC